MSVVDAYSPEEAMLVAKKMFQRECAGWGDEDRALTKLARQCGMSAISYKRLMKGQRKVVDVVLFKRLRVAYLTLCRNLITQLENDIQAMEGAHGHAAVVDLIEEVEGLGAKVRAAEAHAAQALKR